MQKFITKHQDQVLGTLSGFDRVRFRGSLRVLSAVKGVFAWMCQQGVLLKNFRDFSAQLTAQIKTSIEELAQAAGRRIEYLASSSLSKEVLVQEIMRREGVEEGVVCILSCVEPCRSFGIKKDPLKRHIDLESQLRKCLHWYVYMIHPVWGLCHVRIQSWLPFTVHVCVNGREWLCRELTAEGISFGRRDNCLTWVKDQDVAQRLLDAQPWYQWSDELQSLLAQTCPALTQLQMHGAPLRHYWSASETEWATDVMFRSGATLDKLYPSLVKHAMTMFSSPDVMRFLGKKTTESGQINGHFQGEVVSDLKTRAEGIRVKHRINSNSIKMYDKQGSVLRVETTINDASDFKVYRASEADPEGPKSLRKMRKGVVELPARSKVSQSANRRYLEGLAEVESAEPLHHVLDKLSQAIVKNGHRSRGLHPLVGRDAQLASELLRGEFSINGFRNRDVRVLLFGKSDDHAQIRRDSAKTSRLLRLFKDHHLIYRVKGTHRYQLTAAARRTLPSLVSIRNTNTQKLQEIAV